MTNLLQISALFFLALPCCIALECYVCENQQTNKDKCIKTTIQCQEEEDACLTHINYKVPPYWTMRGDRIHYVSKNCDTLDRCLAQKAHYAYHCKRDWYDDWRCVECCQGDLCNYYVTLGSSSLRCNMLIALLMAFTALLVTFW